MAVPSDQPQYPEVPESFLQGVVRTSLDHPNPTEGQLARKARSIQLLQEAGLLFLESLPVIEDASAITPRTADEIADRAIAVCLTAVKGEGLEQEIMLKIVTEWGADHLFTQDERAFILDENPGQADRAKFAWRYECLDVLLWALGYKEELPPPSEICDVPADVGVIKEQGTQLAQNGELRSIDEILDMADYYYRLHWTAIELRLNNQSRNELDEEIVMERHYALNWLISYMGQQWDDVTTDT